MVLCNLPFIIIQRYNRPMLVALASRLEAREERRRLRAAARQNTIEEGDSNVQTGGEGV